MDKHTIGGFMAALRRSQGYTQQEVADRLNVSNKTVSKWERDESCPDIGLIPVIAELFGVTCEELLLGERKAGDARPEGAPPKAEKQLRRMIGATVVMYKNSTYFAALLAAVGLIAAFTVSYGFYKTVLGFGLCTVMAAAGAAFTLIQLNLALGRLNVEDYPGEAFAAGEAGSAGQVFAAGETGALKAARVTLFRCALAGVVANVWAVVLALPFVTYQDEFIVDAVITLETYFQVLPLHLVMCGLVAVAGLWIMGRKVGLALHPPRSLTRLFRPVQLWKLNLIQLCLPTAWVVYAYLLSLGSVNVTFDALSFLIIIAVCVVSTCCFAVKAGGRPRHALIIATGVRNLIIICLAVVTTGGWSTMEKIDDVGNSEIYSFYDGFPVWALLLVVALIGAASLIVKHLIYKRMGDIEG